LCSAFSAFSAVQILKLYFFYSRSASISCGLFKIGTIRYWSKSMIPLALWLLTSGSPAENPLPAILPSQQQEWPAISIEDRSDSPVSQPLPTIHVGGQESSFLDPDLMPELKRDGDKRRKKLKLSTDWAAVRGELSIRDPDLVRNDPMQRGTSWATDETVRVPLNESLFVFGSVDAANDSVEQRQLRYLTKTGLGLKVRPWLLDEVQLKGGPVKRYDEIEGTDRSEMFVEVTTKVPIPWLGPVDVEWSGFAVPAVTLADRDRLNQNLKFILPFAGGSSEFQVGARWWSIDQSNTTPWTDRTHVFLGLQLRR
jgi:hypothetical protein